MVYEIKNLFGGICGVVQLLDCELNDEDQWEYICVIIDEVDCLCSLVDCMLGLNKVLKLVEINIYEVLEWVGILLEVESKGWLVFCWDYDLSILEFGGDKEQFIQVFLNIVCNVMEVVFENQIGYKNEVLFIIIFCIWVL